MKIRVLTGCQMEGLVSALRIMFPSFDVEGFHSYRLLTNDRAHIHEQLRAADLVFALPLERKFDNFAFDEILNLGPKVFLVPHVIFAAFHPDITYVLRTDETHVQTPLTDYNSAIAAAAYLAGFDVKRTVRFYNAFTYQALGYFDLLEKSCLSLLADFASHGIDLRAPLSRWLDHREPFMYSMNHPKSFVLTDVAIAASRAAGLWDERPPPSFAEMPDHLAGWVVYPVYPEIAARTEKDGSTQFKTIGAHDAERLTLAEFVTQSFASYSHEDTSKWKVSSRINFTQSTLQRLAARPTNTVRQQKGTYQDKLPMTYTRPQIVDDIDSCFFYHTTDLGEHGVVQGSWDLRDRFSDYIGNVDLTGQRVLDVGTASGFLSFSAEDAGAKEVVSVDLDSADRQHLLPFSESDYVKDHAKWSLDQTAGFQRWKNAYWFTHRLRGSKAKVFYGDVYALPEALGQFDVVILGAILEHLADPIRALASVAERASKYIIINTDYIDTEEPMALFNGRPDRPDASYIFWTYSIKTYEHIMGIIGFEIVDAKKSKFLARESTGEWVNLSRLALVCRRK